MKQLFITLSIVILATTGIFAQPPGGGQGRQNLDPEEMAKKQTEQMVESLGLNAEQAKAVEKINLDAATEMKKMFEAPRDEDNREQMREQMKAFMDKKNKALKEVLTEEQYKLMLEQEKAKREERQKKRAEGHGTRGGQRGGEF